MIIKRKTDKGIKVEAWTDKNGKWEKEVERYE